MLVNVIFLVAIAMLTMTSKNKAIGVMVSCYYAAYILMDLLFFGANGGAIYTTHDQVVLWYAACFVLSFTIVMFSIALFFCGNSVAGVYAMWLIIVMIINALSLVFQIANSNSFLLVYNVIQNISVYIDLFIVFIGTDHIIKRCSTSARCFIDCICDHIDSLCNMGVNSS